MDLREAAIAVTIAVTIAATMEAEAITIIAEAIWVLVMALALRHAPVNSKTTLWELALES